MTQSPLQQLNQRILSKKSNATVLTNILAMARDFSCVEALLGKEYEVYDPQGNLVWRVREKPIAAKQINELINQYTIIKKIEEEEYKKASKKR